MTRGLNITITALVSALAVAWVACTPFGSHVAWTRCLAVGIMGAVVGVLNLMRPRPSSLINR